MKVLFKQPRSIDGVDYPKGTHEVSDKLKLHWYFIALQVNGDVTIQAEAPKAPAKKEQTQTKDPVTQDSPAGTVSDKTYHQHQADWESKADKKAQATQTDKKPKGGKGSKKADAPKEQTI